VTRAFFSWSGGKDSMLALHRALDAGHQVDALFAMFDEDGARSRSHGLSPAMVAAQAAALGIPLVTRQATWADYEEVFVDQVRGFADAGFTHGLFGDIDLAAHRAGEERVCARGGVAALLPLWGEPRPALAREVLAIGVRARVVCVDGRWLDVAACGREFDAAFLADLPADVDEFGENGEFHTFVFDGPRFAAAIPHRIAAVHTVTARPPATHAYFVAELAPSP
jgi:uncharacterized protein (TIGR00290 family)